VVIGEVPAANQSLPQASKGRQATGAALQANYTDSIPPDLEEQHPTASAFYAVETLNTDRRSAGFSNRVQVALAPALPAPHDLAARVTAEGVTLTWIGSAPAREIPGLGYYYRVYRRESGKTMDAIAGEVSLGSSLSATFLDRSFEWQKTYRYRVAGITRVASSAGSVAQVEGDDSPLVEASTTDVFPPAVPAGVQAVFSGSGQPLFVDLTWAPVTDADLAGYNVYRREETAQAARVNPDLVKAPAFRDDHVEAGKNYFYSVTAVDLRGNESARSEETSESVPEIRNSASNDVRRDASRTQR
jgi:hypothetical protein